MLVQGVNFFTGTLRWCDKENCSLNAYYVLHTVLSACLDILIQSSEMINGISILTDEQNKRLNYLVEVTF